MLAVCRGDPPGRPYLPLGRGVEQRGQPLEGEPTGEPKDKTLSPTGGEGTGEGVNVGARRCRAPTVREGGLRLYGNDFSRMFLVYQVG
jgi:hypothetical protein